MRKRFWLISTGAVLGIVCLACVAAEGPAPKGKLPKPRKKCGVDLLTALRGRHSSRSYDAKKAVPDDILATVLWAADGVNREDSKHTSPCAIGLRYMRIYVCRADGASRYDQDAHRLLPVTDQDLRGRVGRQKFVGDAPVVLVLTSDLSVFDARGRMATAARRREWSHATAGCIAQNVYLAAEAHGLGTVMAALLKPDEVRKGLSLKADEVPLYIMPLGYPPAK